jgi:ubiquinone/menaquinone biosynthesis C-methylase UbiE
MNKIKHFESIFENSLLNFYGAFKPQDISFIKRLYSGGLSRYVDRLKKIGFHEYENILDAGSGFGQWSLAMSELANKNIYSCDIQHSRIDFLINLSNSLNKNNIHAKISSLELLQYPDNFFDAIFSYSVLQYTDYKKVLNEFKRVLKPGGNIYICTNGVGWYFSCITNPKNSSIGYDPTEIAFQAIENSIHKANGDFSFQDREFILPSKFLIQDLKNLGFKNFKYASEGFLLNDEDNKAKVCFFPQYKNYETVYEIICTKE